MCSLKFTLVYWKWGSTGVAFWASSIWWSRVSLSSDIVTATSSSPETDNTCIFYQLQLGEAAFIFIWHKQVKFSTLRSSRGNSNSQSMLKSSVILKQQQQQQQHQQHRKTIPCLFHLHGTWSIQWYILSYKAHNPQPTPGTHFTFKLRKTNCLVYQRGMVTKMPCQLGSNTCLP